MSTNPSRTALEYVQDNRGSLKLKGEQFTVEPEYRHARFLPSITPPSALLPPLEPFEHDDPGHRALKLAQPRAIFEAVGVRTTYITPGIGSEISGLKLHALDSSGRDQVALEVARRGVVAFRSQEFGEQSFDWLKAWGAVSRLIPFSAATVAHTLSSICQHFGRLHIHQTSTAPKGFDEAHLVYREGRTDGSVGQSFNEEDRETLSSIGWHSTSIVTAGPPEPCLRQRLLLRGLCRRRLVRRAAARSHDPLSARLARQRWRHHL